MSAADEHPRPDMRESSGPAVPALRVVGGSPTPEELAVVAALVAAAAHPGGTPSPPRPARGGWSDPARRLRRPLVPGPNAWRSSGR